MQRDLTSATGHIISYGTEDCLRRLEQCGKQHGYQVAEWLAPGLNGGLRVAATMKIKGREHGLGFKWDGADLNVLATRCMSLDLAMSTLPEHVARRPDYALWLESEH